MALTCGILNEYDREKVAWAIKALDYTLTDKIELAKVIYATAFSSSFSMNGSPADVLEKLFCDEDTDSGNAAAHTAEATTEESIDLSKISVAPFCGGRALTDVLVRRLGKVGALPCEDDLIVGDLLLVQSDANDADSAKIYVYNGKKLCELTKPRLTKFAVQDVLEACADCDRYALLRPSLDLAIEVSSTPLAEAQNEAQNAVIETAKNYLLRGYRLQYDDTTSCANAYRWQIRERAPEDYTSEYWGYSNCAAFTIDCHKYSWGYETEDFSTRHMDEKNPYKAFRYDVTGNESDKEKEQVKRDFFAELRPADIINVRYSKKNSGHAMLHVGYGNIIHSGGQNYNYSEQYPAETYENTIRIMRAENLFNAGDRRYVFSELKSIEIIRPLDTYNGTIPENTKNRIKNLRGIVAEKLCSKKKYNCADRGEEIIFTFSIFNSNDESVSLDICDVVPNYTEYVGGAQKKDGDNLYWRVEVGADERVSISYTVKVKSDAPYGEVICGKGAKIGGVSHTCPSIVIGKKLSDDEKKALLEAVRRYCGKGLGGIECANAIYKDVLGAERVFEANSTEDITDAMFDTVGEKCRYKLKKDSLYARMLPTFNFYGGQSIAVNTFFADEAARMVRPEYLMAGDVILSVKSTGAKFYIFTGDDIIEMASGESVGDKEAFTAHLLATKKYFAVFRPSLVY